MADDLSFDLHALVARLDRSADRLFSGDEHPNQWLRTDGSR